MKSSCLPCSPRGTYCRSVWVDTLVSNRSHVIAQKCLDITKMSCTCLIYPKPLIEKTFTWGLQCGHGITRRKCQCVCNLSWPSSVLLHSTGLRSTWCGSSQASWPVFFTEVKVPSFTSSHPFRPRIWSTHWHEIYSWPHLTWHNSRAPKEVLKCPTRRRSQR